MKGDGDMTDITQILLAVIALMGAVVTGVVIPWVRARTTATQRDQLSAWARIAVQAAEQIYAGAGRGEEKKAYALAWLAERGLTFDADAVDAAIEAAVYELTK